MKVFILSTQFLLILLDLKIIQGNCEPGHYLSQSQQCTPCMKGFFKPLNGTENCTACPKNATTSSTGSTSNSNCTIVTCEPGHYLNSQSQQCTPCMKGFFKPLNGTENCTACPKNATTSSTGSTSNSNCTIGNCEPGHYLNSQSQQCTPCMKGFFKPLNGTENCTACPKNATTSSTGSTSNSNCTIGTPAPTITTKQTTTTTASQPTTRTPAPTITTKQTTTTTTSQPTTKNEKDISNPKIQDKNITMSYELIINITFNETLAQKNSEEYNTTCDRFEEILQKKFQSETGVRDLIVKVKGFKNGSLIVQYEVIVPTLKNTTVKNLIALDENFKNAATNWTNYEQTFDGNVDSERTKIANKNTFLQSVCHCWTDEYVCVSEHISFRCEHKCNSTFAKSCGKYGHCVYDRVSKEATCLCKHTDSQIFFGEICEHSMLKTNATTTTPTKIPTTPDPFPVSKLYIIAISGGTGGALLMIILISTICFCYRLKHTKRTGSFSETSSKCDSDIIRDNKKMESIPLESGKLNPGYRDDRQESGRRYPLQQPQTTKSNSLYRDDFDDQRKSYQTNPEPRYQDHDRITRGSFNPQTSNDRLRTESSGNRQPVKHNYYNDSEPSYHDQRESENSYRPRGFSNERNNRRVWPEENGRDRNNSRGWLEESNNDRNKPIGRSEGFDDERNNPRRWPEEKRNDRNYPRERSKESSIGDDRYVRIEGDGGVRRLFKRVDDKDLGGETLIYQPSNMPRPIQRENVDSVGDNFIMRPAPPQDDERRSFYDTIDSENPYKIQRPIIKHNYLYS